MHPRLHPGRFSGASGAGHRPGRRRPVPARPFARAGSAPPPAPAHRHPEAAGPVARCRLAPRCRMGDAARHRARGALGRAPVCGPRSRDDDPRKPDLAGRAFAPSGMGCVLGPAVTAPDPAGGRARHAGHAMDRPASAADTGARGKPAARDARRAVAHLSGRGDPRSSGALATDRRHIAPDHHPRRHTRPVERGSAARRSTAAAKAHTLRRSRLRAAGGPAAPSRAAASLRRRRRNDPRLQRPGRCLGRLLDGPARKGRAAGAPAPPPPRPAPGQTSSARRLSAPQ
jgi:hypothetical protein